MNLVAVDKAKYFFTPSPPQHLAPELAGGISLAYNKQTSKLNLSWPKATDKDTNDSLLAYEINFSTSTSGEFSDSGWVNIGNGNEFLKPVFPGDEFSFAVRAKDEFENLSGVVSSSWKYPDVQIYINQNQKNGWSSGFGTMSGDGSKSGIWQTILPDTDFQFNKIIFKIRHSSGGEGADLRLRIYDSNVDGSGASNLISTSILPGVWSSEPEGQDLVFSFASPVALVANLKYWLVLDVESYQPNSWLSWGTNGWIAAVSNSNPYLGGGSNNGSNTDWYMRFWLEN